ncbi:hypothetical protein BDN72DRAFT_411369 [Pluteus cervinus]|uniref:Uncharacterized protein n=1 Tax=Pluteus cervinus TaxID=181527 RepID=A0ACD3A8J1_9AGAR|nr:hypothetical protein BDN72DRAFT_411369 [Pluteus cervinus]
MEPGPNRFNTTEHAPSAEAVRKSVSPPSQVGGCSSVGSEAGPSASSLEYSPTSIPTTQAKPKRLPDMDETGPARDALYGWLHSRKLSGLYLILVQYGCTSIEHLEAMTRLSDDDWKEIIEALKASVRSDTESPTDWQWFFFPIEVKKMRKD